MSPRNWSSRKSPADMDNNPVALQPVLEFDLSRPWPERYYGQTFGPGYINKVLASGKYILCVIDGIPEQWPISGARWVNGVLEVQTLQGWRIPERLWTIDTLKGVRI